MPAREISLPLRREIVAARARAARSLRSTPHAVAARYSSRSRSVTVTLTNGASFSLPVALVPSLSDATDSALRAVTVGPAGVGLRWESLDADISVVAMARLALGSRILMSAAGAAGGSVRSRSKAVAARSNGKKGGRPPRSAKDLTKRLSDGTRT